MAFISGRRRGELWEDVQTIDSIIEKSIESFRLSSKDESDLERSLTVAIQSNVDRLNNFFISKVQTDKSVSGVKIFGKNTYPDMILGDDGIAIEIARIGKDQKSKFSTKMGDSYIFRLKYKFVFQILVIDENNKDVWEELADSSNNIHFLLDNLTELEIFTYVIPTFKVKGENQFYKFFK